MSDQTADLRFRILEAIIHDAPVPPGRTVIMKLSYFLQILFGIPLGYRFSLYTYGPYDQEVLNDLATIERRGMVRSRIEVYPNGSQGYLYSKSSKTSKSPKLGIYNQVVGRVLAEFGDRSAVDLEMASTIVFVDRSNHARATTAKIQDISRKVHEIKPHLGIDRIQMEAKDLLKKGHLLATLA